MLSLESIDIPVFANVLVSGKARFKLFGLTPAALQLFVSIGNNVLRMCTATWCQVNALLQGCCVCAKVFDGNANIWFRSNSNCNYSLIATSYLLLGPSE